MSYNPYPNANQNYSPYFQQSTSHDGRNQQYADQSRNHTQYHPNSCQPLSACQSTQRPQSSAPQPTNSGTAYANQGYAGGAANDNYQDSKAGYTDGRSSVDNSALGNLAYASSLGRENYDRNPATAAYGTPSSCGANHGQSLHYSAGNERTDGGLAATSRDDRSARLQLTNSSPSFGYSSNNGGTGYQSQQPSNSAATQGGAQRTGAQQPRPSFQQPQINSYNNQISRPSSGQAIQRPHSTTGSQAVQSPIVNPSQVSSPQSAQHGRNVGSGRLEVNRAPTPQQQNKRSLYVDSGLQAGANALTALSTQGSNNPATTHVSKPHNDRLASAPNFSKVSHHKPSPVSNDLTQSTSTNSQDDGKRGHTSTPTLAQFPTTVNPSQVFNDVEYQRRQAAAVTEAESAKKKEANARPATQVKVPNPIPNQPARPPSVPQGTGSDAELAKKNQMELEMKTMIEKMRDYKSKDPSLLSEIWDQVKKGQPPRTSAQSAPQGSAASPVIVDDQIVTPGSNLVQLPPASEIPAAEAYPPGFDRGRFPAQRRRRGGANYTPPPKASLTPKARTQTPIDSGSRSMQKAMTEFQKESTPSKASTTAPVARMVEKQSDSQPSPSIVSTNARPIDIPKAGGTYWPEDKKRQLAEAARVALTSTPPNKGKEVTAEELHKLLDQNPSYTQMCEILEQKGFIIDRSQFARMLLSAVPDLGATTSRPPPGPSPQEFSARSQIPPTAPPSNEVSVSAAPRPPPNGLPAPTTIPPPHPSASQAAAPPPYPAVSRAAAPHPTNHPTPQAPPNTGYRTPYAPQPSPGQLVRVDRGPVPTSHPAAPDYYQLGVSQREEKGAGMRNGPDYVGQPSKSARWSLNGTPYNPHATSQRTTKQDMARKRTFGEIVDLTQGLSDSEDVEPLNKRPRTGNLSSQPSTAPPAPNRKSLEDFRFKPSAREHLHSQHVVRPMDKRKDALRRSSYNPKTIARDVLVALGRHPKMAPLNSHLDPLRERFIAVNHDSDLSTFRWDLVDPGGPPASVQVTRENVGGITRSDQRPDLAVVIGSSGGSGNIASPAVRPRNGKGMKPSRGGYSTFSTRPTAKHSTALASQQQTATQGPENNFSDFVNRDLPVMLNSITGNIYPSSTPSSASGPRRAGRPPGAKNKNPRSDKGFPKNRGTPTDNRNTSTKNEETPSRPRVDTATPARPSGLRNTVTPKYGIAVIIPSRSPSVLESPHPRYNHSTTTKIPSKNLGSYDKPTTSSYKVYKCLWDKCPSELHNLETLKKHVRKHRNQKNPDDGPLPCLWANCYSKDVTLPHIPDVNIDSQHERLTFESESAWDQHVESQHINAIARELGDAPSPPSSSKSSQNPNPDRIAHEPKDAHSSDDEVEELTEIPKTRKPIRVSSSASTLSSAKPMVIISC